MPRSDGWRGARTAKAKWASQRSWGCFAPLSRSASSILSEKEANNREWPGSLVPEFARKSFLIEFAQCDVVLAVFMYRSKPEK